MTIGEKIQNARKNAKMTQEKLGAALGVSPQMIAQYEKGTRNPKTETLRRIADALKVPLYELTDGKYFTMEEFEKLFGEDNTPPVGTKVPLVTGKGHADKTEITATLRKSTKEKLDTLNYLGVSKAYDYIGYLADNPENTNPDK